MIPSLSVLWNASENAAAVAAIDVWWEAAIADITRNQGGSGPATNEILSRTVLVWMASEIVPIYSPGGYCSINYMGRGGTAWEDRHEMEHGVAVAAASVAEARKIQTEAIVWAIVSPQKKIYAVRVVPLTRVTYVPVDVEAL